MKGQKGGRKKREEKKKGIGQGRKEWQRNIIAKG